MKTLLVIFAVAALCGSNVRADDALALPALGTGDPKLLVWMNPDLIQFYILAYTGEKSLPEQYLFADNIEAKSLKLLYPHHAGTIGGIDFQHCFPFGNGQGFLRRMHYDLRNPSAHQQVGTASEIMKEWSDVVLFEEQNGRLVTKVLSDETLNQKFDLKPGSRFLGELDNIRFYWNQQNEDTIFGRDTKKAKVYCWKIPGVYIVLGVLRGTRQDYEFVVFRQIHKFANATGEKTVIEVSAKDAVIE